MVPSVFNLVVCSVWDKTGDVWSHKLYDPNPAQCGYSLNGSTLLHEESCGIFKWFIPATWWPLVILHLLVLTTQTNIKRKSFVLIWVGIKGHHACNILKYNTLFIWIIPYTKYFVIREGRGGYKGGGGLFQSSVPIYHIKRPRCWRAPKPLHAGWFGARETKCDCAVVTQRRTKPGQNLTMVLQ